MGTWEETWKGLMQSTQIESCLWIQSMGDGVGRETREVASTARGTLEECDRQKFRETILEGNGTETLFLDGA